jgi:hypothetical protein
MVDCPPLRPGVLLSGNGENGEAAHLLNVSFSRARGKLVVLADVSYFAQSGNSRLATGLLTYIAEHGTRKTTW